MDLFLKFIEFLEDFLASIFPFFEQLKEYDFVKTKNFQMFLQFFLSSIVFLTIFLKFNLEIQKRKKHPYLKVYAQKKEDKVFSYENLDEYTLWISDVLKTEKNVFIIVEKLDGIVNVSVYRLKQIESENHEN